MFVCSSCLIEGRSTHDVGYPAWQVSSDSEENATKPRMPPEGIKLSSINLLSAAMSVFSNSLDGSNAQAVSKAHHVPLLQSRISVQKGATCMQRLSALGGLDSCTDLIGMARIFFLWPDNLPR